MALVSYDFRPIKFSTDDLARQLHHYDIWYSGFLDRASSGIKLCEPTVVIYLDKEDIVAC